MSKARNSRTNSLERCHLRAGYTGGYLSRSGTLVENIEYSRFSYDFQYRPGLKARPKSAVPAV